MADRTSYPSHVSKPLELAHEPIVQDLIRLVSLDDELAVGLRSALRRAELSIKTLDDLYDYLDRLVTLVPSDRSWLAGFSLEFYYIIDCSVDGFLKTHSPFQRWALEYVDAWARFLDTLASTTALSTFHGDRRYQLPDYQCGPSGWLSFNQFFARQPKPGKRPVHDIANDQVVVSPADCLFMAQSPISPKSTITVKHATFDIQELMDESEYGDQFAGGTFTHCLLNTWDYHRFHAPVRGHVLESKKVPGIVGLDITKNAAGKITAQAGTGFQFKQDRGLLVLDSPIGLVALLPIGMAEISSIELTAEVGVHLTKGEEFGYFQFGGSDIVTLYQADRIDLAAENGTHYNQGVAIGRGRETTS